MKLFNILLFLILVTIIHILKSIKSIKFEYPVKEKFSLIGEGSPLRFFKNKHTNKKETSVKKLSSDMKKIEKQYNESVKDVCKGLILPSDWKCFKDDIDISKINSQDSSFNKFYFYNDKLGQKIEFDGNSPSDIEEKILSIPPAKPLLKHRISLNNINQYLYQNKKSDAHTKILKKPRFVKLSDKKVDMVYNYIQATNPNPNITKQKIKLSYVWDLHGPRGFGYPGRAISKLCPQYREMLDEDHRNRIKKITWNDNESKNVIYKDNSIVNIVSDSIDHDDKNISYNSWLTHKLNQSDKNGIRKQYIQVP